MAEHPDASVRQLDSVEGIKGGAVLLTIHFAEQQLQLAFLRQHNDSQSVIAIFDRPYFELRMDIFIELFPVLLADNSSEFSNPSAIELDAQGTPTELECSIVIPVYLTRKGTVKTTTN